MKKLLLILIPLILIVGTVVGLGVMGIIKLPFLPSKKPAKKPGKPAAETKKPEEKKDAPASATTAPPPKPKPKVIVPQPDVEAGQKKLARVWDSLDAQSLVPIIKDWKDPELAGVLVKMDPDKVTELLAALDPARASKLSRAIEAIAAKPKTVVVSP